MWQLLFYLDCMEAEWVPHYTPYPPALARSLDEWKSDKSRSFHQHFPAKAKSKYFQTNWIVSITFASSLSIYRDITRDNEIKEM